MENLAHNLMTVDSPAFLIYNNKIFKLNIEHRRLTLYARVTTVPVEPGKLDDTVSIIQESVTPVMEKQAGYRGALLLANPDKNVVTSITLWETTADLTGSQFNAAYQDQISQLSELVAGPPMTETYEVKSRE